MKRHATRRGFTLVELMAAVAIVGVLAALAVVGYRRYIDSAQASEATAVISGIRIAEEAYKAETLTYLGCTSGGDKLDKYYPRATPNSKKAAWVNASGNCYNDLWRPLNVVTDGPVRFVYAIAVGNPGTTLPAPTLTGWTGWPATASDNPWYVVQAMGDRNDNGKFAVFVSSSVSGEVLHTDDTE